MSAIFLNGWRSSLKIQTNLINSGACWCVDYIISSSARKCDIMFAWIVGLTFCDGIRSKLLYIWHVDELSLRCWSIRCCPEVVRDCNVDVCGHCPLPFNVSSNDSYTGGLKRKGMNDNIFQEILRKNIFESNEESQSFVENQRGYFCWPSGAWKYWKIKSENIFG